MSTRIVIEPEYVYITIPKEYICVYHRILAMLADYGEDMLKDCKASCTDKNKGVIECFNMFNAAVAARKLEKTKLAETIIKYVKAKINQIYNKTDNSTDFVFPIDENGDIKAFVSCGETVKFEIDSEDGELYAHKFGDGIEQHFVLSEDDIQGTDDTEGLKIVFTPLYHKNGNTPVACCSLLVYYNGNRIPLEECAIEYQFDGIDVIKFEDVTDIGIGNHTFKVTVTYNGETKVAERSLSWR